MRCGIGSWGARCLSMAPYAAGTGPTDGATAPSDGANVPYAPHLDLGDDGRAEEFMQKTQAVCERARLEPDALVVLPFLD